MYYARHTHNIACVGAVHSDYCQRCSFCIRCFNCSDCEECIECTDCHFCIDCSGLTNAAFRIANKKVSISEFFQYARFSFDNVYLRELSEQYKDNCVVSNDIFTLSEFTFSRYFRFFLYHSNQENKKIYLHCSNAMYLITPIKTKPQGLFKFGVKELIDKGYCLKESLSIIDEIILTLGRKIFLMKKILSTNTVNNCCNL